MSSTNLSEDIFGRLGAAIIFRISVLSYVMESSRRCVAVFRKMIENIPTTCAQVMYICYCRSRSCCSCIRCSVPWNFRVCTAEYPTYADGVFDFVWHESDSLGSDRYISIRSLYTECGVSRKLWPRLLLAVDVGQSRSPLVQISASNGIFVVVSFVPSSPRHTLLLGSRLNFAALRKRWILLCH